MLVNMVEMLNKAKEEKYYITQETKARFISVYNDFTQDIECAKKEQNGFLRE